MEIALIVNRDFLGDRKGTEGWGCWYVALTVTPGFVPYGGSGKDGSASSFVSFYNLSMLVLEMN